ncbi:FAD-dependent 5-carboxymethylaminomethyl-2-thiouridine(34) oxidoreductase MnmC [Pseudoduganella albidiflava]|uniref:tRNA 5-methylaminomethyl-2-thiouridine biosynthesis bifunctional protein MnmC n=1 Tax=Pseudoduganella albidiflava TaxID=321983 RepID=A0AA87Y2S9_9BURK|nr:FAD-dependent 5-carboxymethylaminomethyl-2-thiouridine(34) oxidoreductase MnmC [Pseudoduganella albidiflava]GGY69420.1 tRNA 5-methylaminomethyl-2-thiouridine biosynthesis bifunctional protein MnmC [Pseudoduganella albidiflava]
MADRVILDLAFDTERLAAARAAGDGLHDRLHYIAVMPSLPEVADTELAAHWRADFLVAVPGLHRLELDGGRTLVDIVLGEAEAMLPELDARVGEFIVPSTQAPLRALARLAVPGARLQAPLGDEAWRRALRAAGFSWDAETEPLQARYTSRKPQPPRPAPPVRSAVVIGAGVAGAAACERLCARGWQVTLVERHEEPAQEASGNRAGIFMPLLSRDDNIPTRLTRAAYLYALRRWHALGGMAPDGSAPILGQQCGVLQLARDAEHAALQEEVAGAWRYPEEYVRWLDAAQASALLGSATPHGAWLFPQGGWANPASVCRAMLAACGERLRRVFHAEALALERAGERWLVRSAEGIVLAEGAHVIVACGAGAMQLPQTAPLPLYTMRGQVTHLAAGTFAALPLVVCREAYMTPASGGIASVGATYDRTSDREADRTLWPSSQAENLARAREILGAARVPDDAPLAGRVGLRCMAPDRLPLVGALPDHGAANQPERLRDVVRHPGLHGLLGYASRGLIWAPLAAELLACQLDGLASPLEATLAAALDPGRFLLKARRKTVAIAP